ncbi:hypothetical protein N3K66_004447 [Trichothecium roseum]|uniref:Uncharacterized protein n=1 Tax=Trichothecium roseum TaxID=47278 RepID=A0ACC0V2P8_9HYPO|nr:hypothetical protein N3K66_004447 [Trichothecium roseum]
MSFDQLPAELLLRIQYHLGSSFFREDLSRLHVSKRWLACAQEVIAKDLTFSVDSLKRFVEAISSQGERLSTNVHHRTKTVELKFDRLVDWSKLRPPTGLVETSTAENVYTRRASESYQDLNDNVAALASELQLSRLRKLVLRPEPTFNGRWTTQILQGPCLANSSLEKLLNMRHLTELEFDTASTYAIRLRSKPADVHLCHAINALLPTLQRLRCRMDSICEDIFKVPNMEVGTLPLKDLVVSLSLSNIAPNDYSYRFPAHCTHIYKVPFVANRATIEEKLEGLAALTKGAVSMKLLYHSFPGFDMWEFDALTGQRTKLQGEVAWDVADHLCMDM